MLETISNLRIDVELKSTGSLHESFERCAVFMPLQCDICERIRILRMLLDMPTLRRNKFRFPGHVLKARSYQD